MWPKFCKEVFLHLVKFPDQHAIHEWWTLELTKANDVDDEREALSEEEVLQWVKESTSAIAS